MYSTTDSGYVVFFSGVVLKQISHLYTVELIKPWPVHFTVYHPVCSIRLLHKCPLFAVLLHSWLRYIHLWVFKLLDLQQKVRCGQNKKHVPQIKSGTASYKSVFCSHQWGLPCGAGCSWVEGRWCRCHMQTTYQRLNQKPTKQQHTGRITIWIIFTGHTQHSDK